MPKSLHHCCRIYCSLDAEITALVVTENTALLVTVHINFFDYLSDVQNKAADLPHLTPEACRELLPDKWTKG